MPVQYWTQANTHLHWWSQCSPRWWFRTCSVHEEISVPLQPQHWSSSNPHATYWENTTEIHVKLEKMQPKRCILFRPSNFPCSAARLMTVATPAWGKVAEQDLNSGLQGFYLLKKTANEKMNQNEAFHVSCTAANLIFGAEGSINKLQNIHRSSSSFLFRIAMAELMRKSPNPAVVLSTYQIL